MNASEELYQEVILDHSRHPRRYGCPLEHTHCAAGKNPLCGDEYQVYLTIDEEGIVRDASFEGAGCAISKASASLMMEQLIGKHEEEIRELFEAFHAMVTDPDAQKKADSLGKLAAFSGIWKYPSRVKCAILCWHAVRNALDGHAVATTEA
ncbi:MAG: SUF system NifU family Fe-S cluster assembly protein [Lentisphaerae bacterium]|nr:SUF system NifU family Fe-S cluster assembly protein [Lentisphaerota bacterium]